MNRTYALAAALLLASIAAAADERDPTPTASGDRASPGRSPGAAAPSSSAGVDLPGFRSALEGYRPYRADEPLRPWREINDEVGRVGGHTGALAGTASAAEPSEREETE